MSAAIETMGLTKHYGPQIAVDDLTMRVEPGQVFGFLGPNGAGKSTTIRMLLALQRPSHGRSRLLGIDAESHYVDLHRRLGYLPGDLQLFPRLTGHQHIEWFRRARDLRDERFIRELIERFQVVVDRRVHELSKGNRQKIGLVLAFMHRPELLILDEPTSGLDPLMQHEFGDLLRDTTRDGRTVFLSSHELDEVQRVADHIAIIKDGRLVVEGSVEGLRKAAPHKLEVRFRNAIDPSDLRRCPGVTVTTVHGAYVALDVSGDIAPVLKLIAAYDPVDLTARPADLDELFLRYYQPGSPADAPDAH